MGLTIETYVLTHNSPRRLRDFFIRLTYADRKFFSTPLCVVDQSTNDDARCANAQIAAEYGATILPNENLGASGGRWFCAQLHHKSSADAMFYFEDDLVFNIEQKRYNKFDFPALCANPYDTCISALTKLRLGYVKISFQEYFGDHTRYWPTKDNASFELHRINNYTLLVGDVYWCNWPMLISKQCSQRVFGDQPQTEKTVANHVKNLRRDENMWFGVLATDSIIHSNIDDRRDDDVDLRQPTPVGSDISLPAE